MGKHERELTLKERLGRLRVGQSSAGLGLFAAASIEKGEFIIEYVGPLLTNEEADERGGKYLFEVNNDWTIDGSSRDNIARYLNHCCRPNCEAEVDGRRVFIYAIRDIKEGEELTYDYGEEYVDEFIKPYGCRCAHCAKKREKAKAPRT